MVNGAHLFPGHPLGWPQRSLRPGYGNPMGLPGMGMMGRPTPARSPAMVHRLLKVRTGRQPHETLVVATTVLLGAIGVALPQEISAAVADAFTVFWARAYWAALVVFGSVTLWGIFYRRVEGLLIERAGLTVLAVLYGTLVYAVLATDGLAGLTGTALPACFVVANLSRCWQIRTDLVLIKDYLREHPGTQIR